MLVVGLKIPPMLSSVFLDMIGFNKAVMLRYYRYQCIIDCMFMDDLEDIMKTHEDLFSSKNRSSIIKVS